MVVKGGTTVTKSVTNYKFFADFTYLVLPTQNLPEFPIVAHLLVLGLHIAIFFILLLANADVTNFVE